MTSPNLLWHLPTFAWHIPKKLGEVKKQTHLSQKSWDKCVTKNFSALSVIEKKMTSPNLLWHIPTFAWHIPKVAKKVGRCMWNGDTLSLGKKNTKVTSDIHVEVGTCHKSWDMSKQFGRSMYSWNVLVPNVLGNVRDRYRHIPNKLGEVCKKWF